MYILFAIAVPALGSQPNIVLMMVDDLAYGDLGVTGQLQRASGGMPAIETPNIDALAQQGLMLQNFYATPICASSRAAIMTGFHNGHSSIDRNGGNNGGNALRPVDHTIAENLKAAGYTTGQFGKWGIGGYDHTVLNSVAGDISTAAITHPSATPASQGFDEFYGYLNQLHAHDYYVDFLWEHDHDQSGDPGGMQIDPVSDLDYSHDLIAERSLNFISNHADSSGSNPFFMYAPFTIPHGDYNPPNDAIRQGYLDSEYSVEQANYAAMIKRLDNSIGDIVDRLQDPNNDGDTSDSVYDNTLILFSSDNGGNQPQNNLFGGDVGLRGNKGSVFEGGIKSPFIAQWNGTIAPGQVNQTRIAGIDDLYATLSDVAGAERQLGLDGVSIAGLFSGNQAEKRDAFIFEGNGASWAIRMGDWKLVGGSQLYHLPSDPSESTNVAANQAAIVDLMLEVALDEGVLSDAGPNADQTTHIVQYKSWSPQQGSTDWAAAANWSGGTELNTRGMPANHFDTPPANNWIAQINNPTQEARSLSVAVQSEVLALEIKGETAPTTLRIEGGAALTARNGIRIGTGGTIELNGGALQTMRDVVVHDGGSLVGSGSVESPYDTQGTPFVFTADIVNHGRVDITASTASTATLELVANGGFEEGTQSDGDPDYLFSEIADWESDATTDFDAAKPNNALEGGYRGLIASRPTEPHNLIQNTGHAISLGDELTLSLSHRGFLDWDDGVDTIEATVFYRDDSNVKQTLQSFSVSPIVGDWQSEQVVLDPINDPSADGRELWVSFDAISGEGTTSNEFASLDGVSLTTLVDVPPGPAILSIDGDYRQTDTGRLVIDLSGTTGLAGVDFDQLQVTGSANLAGTIEARVAAGLSLAVGTTFPVLAAGDLQGTFESYSLPDLAGGLRLEVLYTPSEFLLAVGGVQGDYNLDGVVDAADYTVWRDTLGQTGQTLAADGDADGDVDADDYTVWSNNFGNSAHDFGETSTVSLPEPSTSLLITIPIATTTALYRGRTNDDRQE